MLAGVAGRPERIACDLLCVSGGWSPNVALFSQSGGSLRHDETLAAFVPDEARQAGGARSAPVQEILR